MGEKTRGEKERRKKNEGMQLGKALRDTRLSITEEARDVTSPLRIPPGTRAAEFQYQGIRVHAARGGFVG